MNALAEPFFICLLASMIWAPIVFLAAQRLRNNETYADKLWPLALMVAALPAIVAPIVAALGVSLRTPPPATIASSSPIAASTEFMAPVTTEVMVPVQSSPITMAAIFEAAAALYLYGFLMFLALGVIRHIWFAYRIGYAVDMEHPELEAAFEGWRERIGIRRKPRYAFTDVVSSVCVHGFFRPVVLMPEALLDRVSEHDVTLMVAHEMAHIKRGDTTLFAFCTGVKAVFWFNPFMQRIAAQANLAAEQAADALVIARGAERKHYARCFVQGLRFAAGARFTERELVPSFTPFDRHSRRERLDAILSGRGPSGLTMRTRLGIAATMAAAAGLAFAQAALAVTPKPHETLTQAPVEGTVTKSFTQRSVQLDAKKTKEHMGVDIVATRGDIVRASGDGKVVEATKRYRGQTAWGKVVVIDHGHGLVTRYAHLDGYVVNKGDVVKAGDPIGAVGSTGRTGGKAHLHFEVIQNGSPVDPLPVIAAKPMPAPKPLVAPMPTPVIEPLKTVKKFATVAPTAPKTSNDVSSLKFPSPPRAPRVSFDAFKGFEAPDIEIVREEVTEILGAVDVNAELEELEIKVRNFDPNEVQALAKNMIASLNYAANSTEYLNEDTRIAIKENMRAAAENAKKNTKTAEDHVARAKEHITRARAGVDSTQRYVARDIERAKRDREQTQRDHEQAERDRKQAQRDREQAQRNREQAQRNREQLERDAEREQERIEAQIEREIERSERQREKALELAEAERERILEKAERTREKTERAMELAMHRLERDMENREVTLADEKKLLALREEAIRKARKDLDKELAEIKRQRAKLDRAEKNKK